MHFETIRAKVVIYFSIQTTIFAIDFVLRESDTKHYMWNMSQHVRLELVLIALSSYEGSSESIHIYEPFLLAYTKYQSRQRDQIHGGEEA